MRIRNWSRFQHYKHRKPPWVRLYVKLLEDPDWMSQPDSAKALLCELWMVASDTDDGSIPDIELLAWRLRRASKELASALFLINPKFIEDASTMLARCEHDASTMLLQSTEYRVQSTEPPVERVREAGEIDAIDAEREELGNLLTAALIRAQAVTGLDGLAILAHRTVRGTGAPISNPSNCGESEQARKLWRITAERVDGFVAAWQSDRANPAKRPGRAPAWDRGTDSTEETQAMAWIAQNCAEARFDTADDLRAHLSAVSPPEAILGRVATILRARNPQIGSAA